MLNETLLVRTLAALADNLVDDFDVVELLTLLSDRSVEALGVAAAGVMLAAPDGHLQVVASSSDAMRSLELFQLQTDEGPCVDCYRTGEPVVDLRLTDSIERWPLFTPNAIAAGFDAVDSLPMRLRGRTIGALNLFQRGDASFGGEDIVAAQALADVATIAVLQHQTVVDAQTLNNQLNEALVSRIIIEQAKGRIAQATGLDMDGAFRHLRRHARNHNLRLTDLARSIADGTVGPATLDSQPDP